MLEIIMNNSGGYINLIWNIADIKNIAVMQKEENQEGTGDIMDENRAEQIEALEVLAEFNTRLLKNMGIVVKELSGERLEDTDNFIKGIIDAINWELQVVNGTMTLLNDGKERIHKVRFNEKVQMLGKALADKEDQKMAEAFKILIPEFEKLGESVAEVLK